MMKKCFYSFVAVTLLIGWAQSAKAELCFMDSDDVGTGKTLYWTIAATGIPVMINDIDLTAEQKTAALGALQAAFKAYEDIPCSKLKFDIKGSGSSTSVYSEQGAILVLFGDNSSIGGSAYFTEMQMKPESEGQEIDWGRISMNMQSGGGYTVGAEANKIDIQTAVQQMIPMVLGYYSGPGDDATHLFSEIKYNYVNHTLSAEQIQGAQALYYDETDGSGCTQPTITVACDDVPAFKGVVPQSDGTTGDGGTTTGDGGNITKQDGGTTTYPDGSTSGDSGTTTPPKDDDDGGCCRVSNAYRAPGSVILPIIGMGLFMLLRRRRFFRR